MKNPYEILGIREDSTKEEIKKAYRELAKKYHPDQYGDNPLKDLAEDKMRDINEAYDYLMKNSEANYNSYNSYEDNNNSTYGDIRMDIQRGNIGSAEEKLSRMKIRDAEWNYLMGVVHLKKGWHDSAYNHLTMACNLDPSNMEYRQTLNMINNRNNSYRNAYYGRERKNDDMCDLCLKLWCLDTICECFGGDCISCC